MRILGHLTLLLMMWLLLWQQVARADPSLLEVQVRFNRAQDRLILQSAMEPQLDLSAYNACSLLIYAAGGILAVERAAPIFLRFEELIRIRAGAEFTPHPNLSFEFGIICDFDLVARSAVTQPFRELRKAEIRPALATKLLRQALRRAERRETP